ncbi:hypothetical protein FOZ62_022486, partial [Perkinsus olseni]
IPDIKEVDSDVKRIAALSREAKSLLECLRQQPNYESEVIPLIEDGIKKANELQVRGNVFYTFPATAELI